MPAISPVIRYLILCEDVRTDFANPHSDTIIGLLTAIRSIDYPPFPVCFRELCVFVQMTECRGPADLRVEIVHADSGDRVARTKARQVNLPNPLEVRGLVFRIRDCTFPQAGL
jgi:hypothetical protein